MINGGRGTKQGRALTELSGWQQLEISSAGSRSDLETLDNSRTLSFGALFLLRLLCFGQVDNEIIPQRVFIIDSTFPLPSTARRAGKTRVRIGVVLNHVSSWLTPPPRRCV